MDLTFGTWLQMLPWIESMCESAIIIKLLAGKVENLNIRTALLPNMQNLS